MPQGEDEDVEWNRGHRAFLQALMATSTLTFDEAKPMIAAMQSVQEQREILSEDITEADFNGLIAAANARISPFDLEIRSTFHQQSRKRIYSIVNLTSDPMTQLATTHSAEEIGFLKRLLDAMFEKYNTPRQEIMAITSMQALKLCKPSAEGRRQTQNGSETQGSLGQGLTLTDAEKMLKMMVAEGWFEKSRKGFYSLSPRALMELRQWLVETYNDEEDDDEEDAMPRIKQCFACKSIITTGQRCANQRCPCRVHDICIQNLFRAQKSEKCPLCKTDWAQHGFVGERAANIRRPSEGTSMHADTSMLDPTNGDVDDDDD